MSGKIPGAVLLSALCALVIFLIPVKLIYASQSLERGEKVFKKCASCHRVGSGARNAVGPNLNGLFGRRAGSLEDAKYSKALIRAGKNGLVWNADNLDIFIENPKALVSKTTMQFRGIKEAESRADLVAYLRSFSDDPSNIPEAAPTATAVSHDPEVNPSILEIQGDPAFGEYLASECVTCHRVTGNDEGIPSIVGWPSSVFVTAMHAYRSQHRQNPVMRMIAGQLSDEEIASLAIYFETLIQPYPD